jgi:hypothetical protein
MLVSFSKTSIRFYQNVVGPVFDTGGALAATYNAATFIGSGSTLSGIQAAINQASIDGIARVYLPASLHSYDASKISFVHTVQMVMEGQDWSTFNTYAYGAAANATGDDWYALTAAISGASVHGGGLVFLPDGTYSISSGIVMDATQTNSIAFVGRGRRDVVISPALSVKTAIQVGNVGAKTFYGVLGEFTIKAPSGHTGCGLWMQQPSYFNVERINIESYTSGTGLYLAGGAYSTGSEAVRNKFSQILIATCQRPAYLQNADENEWYSCIFGANPGVASAITALEINQGRNNRFYGTLVAGETSSLTTGRVNYTGILLSAPVQVGGNNANNQFYGVVYEGFNQGIWVASSVVNNTVVLFANASICSSGISDSGLNTLYIETANLGVPLYQWPSGTAAGPAFAFRSEGSLGWYRSAASEMDLSYGWLAVPGTPFSANRPTYTFQSNRSIGLIDSAAVGGSMDAVVAGTSPMRFYTNQAGTKDGSAVLPALVFQSDQSLGLYRSGASTMALSYGALALPVGSSASPSLAFTSETSLGFYRSAASAIAVSYGQLLVSGTPFSATLPTLAFTSAKSTGIIDNATPGMDIVVAGTVAGRAITNQWGFTSGSAILPGLMTRSEISLGFFRSGVSTIAMSYGTFNLATQAVRLSMRTLAASAVTASAAKTNVAVDEVVFTIGGASGASLIIYSGGTAYGFNSAFSAAAS